ncbi:MAG: DUF6785 family protein [Candidatus Brocadiia bacterium]
MNSALSAEGPGVEPDRSPRRSFSLRALFIGCLLSVLIGVAEPYLTIYLNSSYLFTDYHEGGAAFFIGVLFILFNVVLAALWKGLALTKHELLFIAAMMFASGSVVTSGGVTHLIPMMSSVYYHANLANQWHNEIIPHLQSWLAPLDPGGGQVAIDGFWEGISPGEPLPWGPWLRPLLLWGVYLMAVWAMLTAIMSFLRKQWVEYEHLSFPIAQIPEELCEAAGRPRRGPSIFDSRMFWLGLGGSFLLYSLWGIAFYAVGHQGRFRIAQDIALAPGYNLRVRLDLVVVGLIFLIPNRIAFSVWSLALLSWFARSLIAARGLGMQENMPYGGPPETQHMVIGALVVFTISGLYYARRHLARAFRCALGTGEEGYDRNEPTSYRTALLTMLVALVVMVVWLGYSGLRLPYALVFVLFFIIVYYAMARIIAQVGLPSASAPVVPASYVGSLFGTANLGPQQVGALAHQFWNADLRNTPAVSTMHGMRLADRRYGLFAAMLLSILIAYVTASITVIATSYRAGASSLSAWFIINSSRVPWWWMTSKLSQNQGLNLIGLGWSGFGAVAMGCLIAAQRAFFWWPLHPVAFLIANTHMVINFWFSIFFAWMLKVAIVRLGGHRAYRKARRLFIGAVLGGFAAGGLWAFIDILTRSTGNKVFSI